ncbi:MAG: YqgE/AlgH family protein [Alphaproteobacteria bacterium]|nr:YqgE/AlgH family protein [Alphaproteobacteria bacterium]
MKVFEEMPSALSAPQAMEEGYLRNHLLVAMPSMEEGHFARSVVYVCAHSEMGAMGIVINQALSDVVFEDLLEQMDLPAGNIVTAPVIHCGGPVDSGRGFVLHSTDFMREDTVRIDDDICMTGTIDILKAIAEGRGPHKSIFALGYAGWGPGQLEAEIQSNSWLSLPVSDDLLFSGDLQGKWHKALKVMGIDLLSLSSEAGSA